MPTLRCSTTLACPPQNPDYDKECTPALCKIARNAGQEVPEFLVKHEKGKSAKLWKADKVEKALATVIG